MGLFGRDKMSKSAGEWAAYAMGCMVFADGHANDAEIAAARGQVATNPVIRKSLGSQRAEKLFNETVEAVAQIPEAMLPSYETKLVELAAKVNEADEKNFALATVVAVAMGDRSLSAPEHAMLIRFRDMLGATIPLPSIGQATPPSFRQIAHVQPPEAATSSAVAPVGADPPAGARTCPTCGQPAALYEGYGYWCGSCQAYVTEPADGTSTPSGAGGATATADAGSGVVPCASCGQSTQYFEGYGHWCAACQRYAAGSGASR
jgi:hypothetical protein